MSSTRPVGHPIEKRGVLRRPQLHYLFEWSDASGPRIILVRTPWLYDRAVTTLDWASGALSSVRLVSPRTSLGADPGFKSLWLFFPSGSRRCPGWMWRPPRQWARVVVMRVHGDRDHAAASWVSTLPRRGARLPPARTPPEHPSPLA